MARIALICIAITFVGGCATDSKPAVCDGQHRRPANPNGSVLSISPPPATATPNKIPPPPKSPPVPGPGPQSSIDPRSFARCGASA